MVIFSETLDQALGWAVLHSIWQATAVAVLVGILLVLLRGHSAQTRYAVAIAGLISVLVLALATFVWHFRADTPAVDWLVNAPLSHGAERKVPNPDMVSAVGSSTLHTVNTSETGRLAYFGEYFERHLPLVSVLWFLGATFFLLRLLSGISHAYYLRGRMNFPADVYWSDLLGRLAERANLKTPIAVLESALTRTPLVVGHLKPVILFPIGVINRLSESEVEAILAHELAHVLRRDYLFNILQSVIEALFYYHPAVWWLSNQVRNERESACDEHAIVLCGNRIGYAKALVTIQEMAFYPLAPALAFAGQRQSQFLNRVRRIFHPTQTHTQFNIMEKWIATFLVACSIIALTFAQHRNNPDSSFGGIFSQEGSNISFRSGLWEAELTQDSICLTMSSRSGRNGTWVHSDCWLQREFSGLPLSVGEVAFKLARPSGTMTFTGKMEDAQKGYGRFEFVPDETYRANLEKQGIKPADDELIVHCFWGNLPTDYLERLKRYGYTNVDKETLQEVAIFRLDEPTIKNQMALLAELGNNKPDLRDLIEFKIHDITKAYVQSLRDAGYTKLSVEKIKEFKIHDVTAQYVRDMTAKNGGKTPDPDRLIETKIHGLDQIDIAQYEALGYKNLEHDDLMNFAVHGIDAPFITAANALGLGRLDPEGLVNLKIHDIDTDFIKSSQALNLGKLNLDDFVTLKVHGIDADFIKSSQALNLGNLDMDGLVALKVHDIDADFIKSSQALNLGKLDMDDLVTLKVHDIDADFIKGCQALNLGKLDLDALVSLKVHGIDADFARNFKALNLGEPTVDNLMSAKIHGITPEFVKSLRDLGFKNLDFDEAMEAKIHGITPEFIKKAQEKGYKFSRLGEYIELKIHENWMNEKRSN